MHLDDFRLKAGYARVRARRGREERDTEREREREREREKHARKPESASCLIREPAARYLHRRAAENCANLTNLRFMHVHSDSSIATFRHGGPIINITGRHPLSLSENRARFDPARAKSHSPAQFTSRPPTSAILRNVELIFGFFE